MAHSDILVSASGDVVVLTLNRPEKLNALRRGTFEALLEACAAIAEDDAARVVVLTGAGKAFSAGADVGEYATGMTPHGLYDFIDLVHRTSTAIEAHAKPFIAAVNGYALGGGLELALCCDLIVSSSDAVLGLPEIGLGLLPGGGGTQRLSRIVGAHKAKELLFLGQPITADEAHRLRLINRVYPPSDLMREALDLAAAIARAPAHALKVAKRLVNAGSQTPLEAALALEQGQMAMLFATEEAQSRIRGFLEKRSRTSAVRHDPGASV